MSLNAILVKAETWGTRVFLIDALGALISALSLGLVLPLIVDQIGLPINTLYSLALIPVVLALFDYYSFKQGLEAISTNLKRIAGFNFLYCLFSIGLLIYHRDSLQLLGWIYFSLELILVLGLAYLEFRLAGKHQKGG